jgi:hypothetical protein
MRRLVVLISVVAGGLASSGCGPIISTYLIVSAQADLDGAKAAEAEKYAVYEYVAANEYLHKAREEQGYADFGPSIDFAYKAKDLAQKATARASDEKQRMSQGGAHAEWQAPENAEPSERPHVIIKKKDEAAGDDVKVRVVPIPVESGPSPK